jgi:hypothetical protein
MIDSWSLIKETRIRATAHAGMGDQASAVPASDESFKLLKMKN